LTGVSAFEAVCEELDRRRQVTLGFQRIEALLKLLGNPETDLRVIQVVGTNGKGTTAVALAAALEEFGYPSGVYLSPHLLSYTERMMVNGEFVSEVRFADVMNEVIKTADENGVSASQFELLTAGALKLFRDVGLSFAVLEAGLGARHDATSAAAAEAVVLTNVGLDHTEYLGETVEQIAREKLASLRSGAVLILGTDEPVVVELAQEAVERAGARLVRVSSSEAPAGVSLAGLAPFAVQDVRVGVAAAREILGRTLDPSGWERVAHKVSGALPGRFEVREVEGVPVVVDGGHNASGLEAALAGVKELYGERPLGVIFGVLRDKDIGSMLTALERGADKLVLTRPGSDRAADPRWIQGKWDPRDRAGMRARMITYPVDALNLMVEEIEKVDGVVLVTGSLYTCAEVLGALREG
jgi:dihydrofolate synthase/folylpolyglutamate synthase